MKGTITPRLQKVLADPVARKALRESRKPRGKTMTSTPANPATLPERTMTANTNPEPPMTADNRLPELPAPDLAAFVEALNGPRGSLDAWLECNDESDVRGAIRALLAARDAGAGRDGEC